jgi:hypothetical protein
MQIPVLVIKHTIETNQGWLGSIVTPSVLTVLKDELKEFAPIQDVLVGLDCYFKCTYGSEGRAQRVCTDPGC